MFGFLKKDPVKKLEKQYAKIMEEAVAVQRSGDLRAYADKIAESEKIILEIEKLTSKS